MNDISAEQLLNEGLEVRKIQASEGSSYNYLVVNKELPSIQKVVEGNEGASIYFEGTPDKAEDIESYMFGHGETEEIALKGAVDLANFTASLIKKAWETHL